MKNSIPYFGDAFEFFKQVCDRKHDAISKARLLKMDSCIQNLYIDYDLNFQLNTLEKLIPIGFEDQQKIDLTQLYNYRSSRLTNLRNFLTMTESGRIFLCQYCTINNINTFDHHVPKGEFVEYIIHPRNLLCCCSECNSLRNNNWRNGDKRTTLNLYTDKLPDIEYLFVNVDVDNSTFGATFYLDNRNKIDNEFFMLLENHYSRLKLFDRFSQAADTIITSFKTVLAPLRNYHDLSVIKAIGNEQINLERIAFGLNYWPSVLKLALLDCDDFMVDFQ